MANPSAVGQHVAVADAGTAAATAPLRRSRRGQLLVIAFFLFGLVSLSFVLGAGVIYFNQPPAGFLRQAFEGAGAWYESKLAASETKLLPALHMSQVDRPDKTCDGFTLMMYGGDCRAVLVNMHGKTVHEWHVPFSQIWPHPPHLNGRIDDAAVYFNDGYLFPNGDIVLVVQGPTDGSNPSDGYGLVKLDRDSHVLWKYAEHCHHDVDVAEDGTVYILVNETLDRAPAGLEEIPTPCVVDDVDVLSPDGIRLKRIHLLDAFIDTPYLPLLTPLERGRFGPPGTSTGAAFHDDELRRDVLHANAVKVLPRALAPRFPLFKAGQFITSLRHIDALAVIDPQTEKVVWGCRGPWRAQHDPAFLDNGRLLLFDNYGSFKGSRVLEYDPQTQSFPWTYPGETGKPFFTRNRGMSQRLPNGNTLIVNSIGGDVVEVTPEREVVWSCSTGEATIYRARRYCSDRVSFVRGSPRDNP